MDSELLIINEKELVAKHESKHQAYEYKKFEVTPRKDFDQCYVAIYELPPKKANYPYHYHMANTEVFFVISGQGMLQTPQGDRIITKGDFIVCPPGQDGAHKIVNTSEQEILKYIDFDAISSPDVIRYPDSDKVGIIIHNQSAEFFTNTDCTDYYSGE